MAVVPEPATAPQPAPHSLGAIWLATFKPHGAGDGGDAAAIRPQLPGSPAELVQELRRRAPEWAQLFQRIPADGKHRKAALGGAVKLRAVGKRLDALAEAFASDATGAPPSDDAAAANDKCGEYGEGGSAEAGAASAAPASQRFGECHAAFREVILGFLEVSFAADELASKDDFGDPVAIAEARERLQVAADLTAALARAFKAANLDPKELAGTNKDSDQSLPPEMLQMLERCMDENRGGASVAQTAEAKAAKAEWERGEDGLCSALLGEEVWEALCWRRGMFLFAYIGALIKKDPAKLPVEVIDEAMGCFDLMLHAQGPIASDRDDAGIWEADSDGQHKDETARMFYHGVYSSSHLRALKFLAELCYWRWKHYGKSEGDAKLAAMVNRKFAHVVRHIIPGAGWTADVERDRVAEVERESLGGTSAYSRGLDDRPSQPPASGLGNKGGGNSGRRRKGKAIAAGAASADAAAGAGAAEAAPDDAAAVRDEADAEGGTQAGGEAGAASEGASRKKRGSKKK